MYTCLCIKTGTICSPRAVLRHIINPSYALFMKKISLSTLVSPKHNFSSIHSHSLFRSSLLIKTRFFINSCFFTLFYLIFSKLRIFLRQKTMNCKQISLVSLPRNRAEVTYSRASPSMRFRTDDFAASERSNH